MIVALTLAVLAAAAPLPQAAEPKPLRVAIDTRQAPWSFVPGLDVSKENYRKAPVLSAAQRKALVGIDVDVVKALERKLGTPLTLVPWSWFSTEAGLLAGDVDLVVSSWTPNPRTPEAVAASPSYYDWGLLLAVRADDSAITTFADLGGRRLGHYRDPAVERSLQAMGRSATLVPSDDPDALFARLKAGEIDAVAFDSPYVRWRVAHDQTLRVVAEPLNRLGYHVGVRAADTVLRQKVDDAIRALTASGELARIKAFWESSSAPK